MDFTSEKVAENVVRFLFSTESADQKILNGVFFRALFVQKNPELLWQVQRVLELFFEELIQTDQNEGRAILIARGIALLPFLDLQGKARVPQCIQGVWQMIDYEVETLALTPTWLGSPLTAYSLTCKGAPTLLLFKGTPAPTSAGCLLSIWTDFSPGYSVGELAFQLFAQKRIQAALQKSSGPVIAYGQSLGGSLALLTACYQQVDEVHAFAPAPLFKRAYRHFKKGSVAVYWHVNDPVPFIGGGFHDAWKFYRIEGQRPQNKFLAHLRCVPGFSKMEQVPSCKREKGSWLPLMHALVSIPIFVVTSVVLLVRSPWYLLRGNRQDL